MQVNSTNHTCRTTTPWKRGKLIGPNPPPKAEIWSIRVRLQVGHRIYDLALFNLAFDSKLRACDLVALRVDDVPSMGGCGPEPLSCNVRLAGPFSLRSRSRPGRPWSAGLRGRVCIRVSHSFRVGLVEGL